MHRHDEQVDPLDRADLANEAHPNFLCEEPEFLPDVERAVNSFKMNCGSRPSE